MIQSKSDYHFFIEADMKARGIHLNSIKSKINDYIRPKPTWKFQKRLRKLEYYTNCKKGIIYSIYKRYLRYKYSSLALKLNYSIPPNVFGPGLCILHYGTIVVNSKAKIGKNCRLEVCVNIGASGGGKLAPTIGNNVYIGPGVKIYGDITLGNNIAIAANSSVNKSFLEDNILIGGSPAKKLKEFNVKTIIKHI